MFEALNIELGINPLTWTNDDCEELGDDISLEQCLSEARLAGFTGIELGRKFPRDARILKPILDDHALKLVSGWYSAKLLQRTVAEEIEHLTPHLHLLKSLGAKVLIFAETSGCIHGRLSRALSKRPKINNYDWDIFTQRLNELAKWLKDQGIQLAYHHHMGTVIESQQDIYKLLESTSPEVGLLLDTGHLSYAKGSPLDIIERFGNRIKHVHCKDTRQNIRLEALDKDLPFIAAVKKGVFTVPGDGEINFDAIISNLIDKEYQGWIVVEAEQDPKKAHPLTFAKMGYSHLSGILNTIEDKVLVV